MSTCLTSGSCGTLVNLASAPLSKRHEYPGRPVQETFGSLLPIRHSGLLHVGDQLVHDLHHVDGGSYQSSVPGRIAQRGKLVEDDHVAGNLREEGERGAPVVDYGQLQDAVQRRLDRAQARMEALESLESGSMVLFGQQQSKNAKLRVVYGGQKYSWYLIRDRSCTCKREAYCLAADEVISAP